MLDRSKSPKRCTLRAALNIFPALLLSLGMLCGCATGLDLKSEKEQRITELHERLSYSISNHGFTHGLRGTREEGRNIDSIYISISLDSLKRRHLSLDQMLADVARICATKEFAEVDIRIELSTGDEADMQYLRGLIEPTLARASNVRVITMRDAVNDIVITTMHH